MFDEASDSTDFREEVHDHDHWYMQRSAMWHGLLLKLAELFRGENSANGQAELESISQGCCYEKEVRTLLSSSNWLRRDFSDGHGGLGPPSIAGVWGENT